jgi:addiction module RelE/StbE family toxin
MEFFAADPHDSCLRTHKLTGELRGLWSFTVEYDVRVVFQFLPNNRVMFVDVGTHDEVY